MNWNASDHYEEFRRFREHVNFVFAGPLCKASNHERSGWIGMWIGQEGREVHKTLQWEDDEKGDPEKVL